MTPISTPSTEAAHRLWECCGAEADSAEGVAAAANRVLTELETGLVRWVGAEGFRVLRVRAVKLAQAEHPAIGNLLDGAGNLRTTAAGTGTGRAVRGHGAPAVAAGMICLIACLVDLLGRIIGEELAVRLVEQTVTPKAGGASGVRVQGDRHG